MNPPADGPLTPEAILAATQDVLRRYGPAKATVVDVARALGVSHGTVYRHFPTKAALREAVTRRWLNLVHIGLADIAEGGPPGEPRVPPAQRLVTWLRVLVWGKRRKVMDDPELFATYSVLAREHSAVVAEHLTELVGQLTKIISAGVATGEFVAEDAVASARAVFQATALFHHPAHAAEWADPRIDEEFNAVLNLLLAGLTTTPRGCPEPRPAG